MTAVRGPQSVSERCTTAGPAYVPGERHTACPSGAASSRDWSGAPDGAVWQLAGAAGKFELSVPGSATTSPATPPGAAPLDRPSGARVTAASVSSMSIRPRTNWNRKCFMPLMPRPDALHSTDRRGRLSPSLGLNEQIARHLEVQRRAELCAIEREYSGTIRHEGHVVGLTRFET